MRIKFSRIAGALLLFCLMLSSVACGPAQIRAGSRAFSQGAQEGKREVQSLVASGDLTPAEATSIDHVLDQLGNSALNFGHSVDGYETLTPAAKRALIESALNEIEPLLDTLEQEGVIKPRSEKARKVFRKILTGLRIGSSILRVVEAALPPDPQPSPN
jgi:hypothetical protein